MILHFSPAPRQVSRGLFQFLLNFRIICEVLKKILKPGSHHRLADSELGVGVQICLLFELSGPCCPSWCLEP